MLVMIPKLQTLEFELHSMDPCKLKLTENNSANIPLNYTDLELCQYFTKSN